MDSEQEKLNLKLVQEVEKYPCLYKTDEVDYLRRSTTEKAWAEVGRVVGWPGPKCKERFKNIRSVVGRSKRVVDSGIKRRPYYLSKAMHYALPYIKSFRESSNKKIEAQPQTDECSNNSFYEEIDDDVIQEVKAEIETNDLENPNEDYSNEDDSSVLSPVPERAQLDPLCQINQSEQRGDMEISSHIDETNALENDHKKMFLLSLLPDVYAMDDKQTRIFKRRVLQLVEDVLDENSINS